MTKDERLMLSVNRDFLRRAQRALAKIRRKIDRQKTKIAAAQKIIDSMDEEFYEARRNVEMWKHEVSRLTDNGWKT